LQEYWLNLLDMFDLTGVLFVLAVSVLTGNTLPRRGHIYGIGLCRSFGL